MGPEVGRRPNCEASARRSVHLRAPRSPTAPLTITTCLGTGIAALLDGAETLSARLTTPTANARGDDAQAMLYMKCHAKAAANGGRYANLLQTWTPLRSP